MKQWQMKGDKLKAEYAQQKLKIQTLLWEKLSLIVDQPKAEGSGTSNDGNTARRAFQNVDLLSQCLGLDHELLHRFKIILITLCVQLPINAVLFEEFCVITAKLYISLYPWYPMPATIHKVLIHGGQIIQNSLLPVGMLGEEASEARNKNYKNFRLHHSRKSSRSANLEDLFCRALDSSDPIISSISQQTRLQSRAKLPLPEEVRNLLDVPPLSDIIWNAEAGEEDDTDDDLCKNNNIFEYMSSVNDQLDQIELSQEMQ